MIMPMSFRLAAACAAFALWWTPPAVQAEPLLADAHEIMQRYLDADSARYSLREVTMTIRRGDEELRRALVLQGRRDRNEGEHRMLVTFTAPAEVNGTKFLVWSYDDTVRNSDMWTWLPATKRIRRIASDSRKGAFMRSDLHNEDMERRALDADTHTLAGSEPCGAVSCYVVESVPKDLRATNYSKRKYWIHADMWLPVRIEYYDLHGRFLKSAEYTGFREISGYWAASEVTVRTPRNDSMTRMRYDSIVLDRELPASLFDQSALN
jgi:Protein of unknown function (DUF1329).